MRHVSDDERRARLASRQALGPGSKRETPESVARALTVLHATEPSTVYLSCWARGPTIEIADIDRALYEERTLVKQLAMRRTLFVFPRDLLAAAWGSAAARVAAAQRRRLAKDLVAGGLAEDGEYWLDRAGEEISAVLAAHPEGLPAAELRALVPALEAKVAPSTSEPWSASRLLAYLGARGEIVRADNDGHWRTARPRWTLPRHWFDQVPERADPADGYRELVRRWLRSFGPGTEDDLVWWLGSTKGAVRTALAELGAVEVSLDGGARGWLLPDDLEEVAEPDAWVALLPVLDPTVMGWKERGFYLGANRDRLFDRQGNAGTTAWVDGRVVGCWVQDDAGVVELRLLGSVSAPARRKLEEEAARLTAWLDGLRIATGWRSPSME